MGTFGVHSEVGKLREVIVHRPDLSLRRLTPDQPRRPPVRRRPVGRARAVRARPVRRADARARRRGATTSRTCSTEALGGERRERQRLIELVAVASTPSGSAPRRRRSARPRRRWSPMSSPPPDRRAHRRRVRARPRRSSRTVVADRRRARRRDARSSCRRCPTPCSPATRRAGSTAASRSTRCTGRPGACEAYNVAAIYQTHPMFAGRRLRVLVSAARRRRPVHGRTTSGCSSLEGGDVQTIGNGTVADRHERAHAGADDRADRRGRCSRRAPRTG